MVQPLTSHGNLLPVVWLGLVGFENLGLKLLSTIYCCGEFIVVVESSVVWWMQLLIVGMCCQGW